MEIEKGSEGGTVMDSPPPTVQRPCASLSDPTTGVARETKEPTNPENPSFLWNSDCRDEQEMSGRAATALIGVVPQNGAQLRVAASQSERTENVESNITSVVKYLNIFCI